MKVITIEKLDFLLSYDHCKNKMVRTRKLGENFAILITQKLHVAFNFG